MKKLLGLVLLTGCVTTPDTGSQNFIQIGENTAHLKSGASIDLTDADWEKKEADCVTHVYRCDIDKDGAVTGLKALDLSSPQFQAMTEEAIRAWRFAPGPDACFAEVIYEKGEPTRFLLLPETMATANIENLQANRKAMDAVKVRNHSMAKVTVRPDYPRDMLKEGKEGYIVLNFDIDPDGRPQNIKVIDEVPEKAWEKSAITSLKQWRYATLAEEPTKLRKSTVTLTYALGDGGRVSTCDLGFRRNRLAQAPVK